MLFGYACSIIEKYNRYCGHVICDPKSKIHELKRLATDDVRYKIGFLPEFASEVDPMIDPDDELMRPCICGCMTLACCWRFVSSCFLGTS